MIARVGTFDALSREVASVAAQLRIMSNPDRLAILCYLADKECSVSEIGKALDLGQPALSQQLAELRDRGLVQARRHSRHIYYSVSCDRTLGMLEALNASLTGLPIRPKQQPPVKRPKYTGEAAQFARLSGDTSG